jgi:CRP-like cAMP-binding protein
MRKRNILIDALPRDVYETIADRFETVTLERGVVLHEPGQEIRHLYFPIDCLVSITITSAEGKTVETGACGNREVIGVNAFMGGSETTQTKYVVQVGGEALKIAAQPLQDAFDENRSVRTVLLKYTLVASAFQKQGFITIHRNLTRICDAAAIARLSCGCYQILADEYDRLLGVRPQF